MRRFSKIAAVLCRLMILVAVSSAGAITSASAHEMRPAVADARFRNGGIELQVDLSVETLLAGIDASVFQDTNDAPEADEYDRLRALDPEALEAELRARWSEISGAFLLTPHGGPWMIEGVSVEYPADPAFPRDTRLTLFAPLQAPGPVAVGAKAEVGSLVLRHMGAGESAFAGLLSPGALSPPLPRTGGTLESAAQTFVRYIVLGVEHIVPKGLDHILFVLGLFFFSRHLRPLLWQVTAFTAAHTVTLALASLGLVTVPASVVEPLIAASIVYVAVENLRSDGTLSWVRTGVVFGFGLLHGLGFASVLGEIGLGQGRFVLSLIGFNIGVELGQLLVIAVAFGAVGFWFGRAAFYRPFIANPISVLIALVGSWWVVERVFL